MPNSAPGSPPGGQPWPGQPWHGAVGEMGWLQPPSQTCHYRAKPGRCSLGSGPCSCASPWHRIWGEAAVPVPPPHRCIPSLRGCIPAASVPGWGTILQGSSKAYPCDGCPARPAHGGPAPLGGVCAHQPTLASPHGSPDLSPRPCNRLLIGHRS